MEVTPNHTLTVTGWAAMNESAGKVEPFVFKRRENGPDDVTIKVQYCGMCHTDLHFINNDWGITTYPLVPGHEITGVVTKAGRNVTGFRVGDRVGVGCIAASCLDCDHCRRSEENYCDRVALTYNGVFWDGSVTYGGYSRALVADKRFVVRVPDALPLDAAAPLLCAGVTVYSPMKHHGMLGHPGASLGVVGLGGLGHVAVKLAKAFGQVPRLRHRHRLRQALARTHPGPAQGQRQARARRRAGPARRAPLLPAHLREEDRQREHDGRDQGDAGDARPLRPPQHHLRHRARLHGRDQRRARAPRAQRRPIPLRHRHRRRLHLKTIVHSIRCITIMGTKPIIIYQYRHQWQAWPLVACILLSIHIKCVSAWASVHIAPLLAANKRSYIHMCSIFSRELLRANKRFKF
uniref:cinnamyl-alcohol dehydrogenase n=1 Tax=Zea mays TaxID=4577 RepID=A0A804MIN8_MAIZE